MTTRPSNDAIAQAFWTIYQELGASSDPVFAATVLDIISSARDIDAQPCATPDNREVSGLANSEWVMVPKEPTEAMLNAGIAARRADGATAETYLAMIAAAPTPPKVEPCPSCEPDGVYATDGTGPWDCYRCGKKAPTPDVIRDAARYREFFRYGMPIRFLGIDHHKKHSLDEAIDVAIREQKRKDIVMTSPSLLTNGAGQRGEKDNG